jgi:hypothetical protein
VDHTQDIAILRPMIAPDIGVQLDFRVPGNQAGRRAPLQHIRTRA